MLASQPLPQPSPHWGEGEEANGPVPAPDSSLCTLPLAFFSPRERSDYNSVASGPAAGHAHMRHDVRMRGFRDRAEVDEVVRLLISPAAGLVPVLRDSSTSRAYRQKRRSRLSRRSVARGL